MNKNNNVMHSYTLQIEMPVLILSNDIVLTILKERALPF